MHHGLGVCDVLQVHVGLVQFHSDGFFHSDVARGSFQLLDLVIAVGGFKDKLSCLIGGRHLNSGFFSEFVYVSGE